MGNKWECRQGGGRTGRGDYCIILYIAKHNGSGGGGGVEVRWVINLLIITEKEKENQI